MNLTNDELSDERKGIPSLGTKIPYKKKLDPFVKKVETEVLFDFILRLTEQSTIEVQENLQLQLFFESS